MKNKQLQLRHILKYVHFCLFIIFMASSCSIFHPCRIKCERFFSYETSTVEVRLLKRKVKKKARHKEVTILPVETKKTPAVVSEKLQQLDFIQFVFCHRINSLPCNDSLRRSLEKDNLRIYNEMLRSTFLEANAGVSPIISEELFLRLRSNKDQYLINNIIARIAQNYKVTGGFPDSLESINLYALTYLIGVNKIRYMKHNDDFTLRFAGNDGKLDTNDDEVYSKGSILAPKGD